VTFDFEAEGASFGLEMELFDYGEPISISLPPPESITETRNAASAKELRVLFSAHLATLIQA
jgi:hypothetical protein